MLYPIILFWVNIFFFFFFKRVWSSIYRLDQDSLWRHWLPGIWHWIWVDGWCGILPDDLHLWCKLPVLHLCHHRLQKPYFPVYSVFFWDTKCSVSFPKFQVAVVVGKWCFFVLCFEGAVAITSVPSPCLPCPKWPNWTMWCPALRWGTVTPARHLRTHESYYLSMILDKTVEKVQNTKLNPHLPENVFRDLFHKPAIL